MKLSLNPYLFLVSASLGSQVRRLVIPKPYLKIDLAKINEGSGPYTEWLSHTVVLGTEPSLVMTACLYSQVWWQSTNSQAW